MNNIRAIFFRFFTCLAFLSPLQIYSICPSGITTIGYLKGEINQEQLSKAISSGLDYLAIDLNVTENDNNLIYNNQLLGKINPVDNQGTAMLSPPTNFAPELQTVLANPLETMGIVVIINQNSLPSDLYIKTLAGLVNNYNRTKKGNPILVGTYAPQTTRYLKKYFPELPFIVFSKNENDLFNHRKFEPKIYALSKNLASQQRITELNNESKGVWIFDIDTIDLMEKYAKEGANGIITDNTQSLIELKMKLAKECHNLINTSS